MKKLIRRYLSLSFEEKILFNTFFSIIFNFIMAIGKIIIGLFFSIYFVASGLFNIFLMLSKIQVYLGIKYPTRKSFDYRNKAMGIYLILAAIQYIVLMLRPILFDVESTDYGYFLGIGIAFVSFVELGMSIIGCFQAFGKGHYYRNIKLINLCSAFTAIVLTETALLSFSSEYDSTFISSLFGVGVGCVIILIGIYILLAPKISIVDRKHNVYELRGENVLFDNKICFVLTNSKFYGNYVFEGNVCNGLIDGMIIKEKSPMNKWNIYVKILVIILSEILIFPYAVGAFVFHLKSAKIIDKLDNEMLKYNYTKIKEVED